MPVDRSLPPGWLRDLSAIGSGPVPRHTPRTNGPTVAFVGYQLNVLNGSSRETDKWRAAFRTLGFDSYVVAGNDSPGMVTIPGLATESFNPPPVDPVALAEALAPADIVVVDNLFSLAYNPAATEAVAAVRAGKPTILRHHDLAWNQPGDRNQNWRIPDDDSWVHTTINRRNQIDLLRRGIHPLLVTNMFDTPDAAQVETARGEARSVLGLQDDDVLLMQPTRANPRKNIPGGLRFAGQVSELLNVGESRRVLYWITGPTEAYFRDDMDVILGRAPRQVGVLRGDMGTGAGTDPMHAYAAADVVVLPSIEEGFGNPTVESAMYRRLLVVGGYPILPEIWSKGFAWVGLNNPSAIAGWVREPSQRELDRNREVAIRHFSTAALPGRLADLVERCGRADLLPPASEILRELGRSHGDDRDLP
jgi:hypothetical protein